MTAPRLLHVTTTDISLALLLGPQLRAFVAAGYEVHAASAPGPWVAEVTSWGVRHHPLDHATRAPSLGEDVRAAAELHRLIRRLRPDIVHTHNPKPGVYGRLGARLARVPAVVNTVHGLYAQPTDTWKRRLPVYALERLAASCSDVELVQNEEDTAVLRRLRVPAGRVRTLGNGVDLDRFGHPERHAAAAADLRAECGVARHEVLVLAVGRLVAEKGFRELFAAARGSSARLVVVGGPEPSKPDALTEAELSDAAAAGVVLLGHRHDVEALYAAADVFVLPSHREGFPRAAMEAAAAGLPAVATDIRGCRQVVLHERTGLLVPVRDSAALGAAIDRLATDPGLRARLGAAARERSLVEFDDRRVIRRTLSAYARALSSAGVRGPAAARRGAVRLVTAADLDMVIPAVAELHRSVLPTSFLATLGDTFLRRLYRRLVLSEHGFLLVAGDDGDVQGFCSGAHDTGALYREFVRRDGPAAGLAALAPAVKRPGRVWETWSYGRSTPEEDQPLAELLSLGVRPDARRLGLGAALVSGFQEHLAAPATVTVGAVNRDALALYERQGFRPTGRRDVHRGERSVALTWP